MLNADGDAGCQRRGYEEPRANANSQDIWPPPVCTRSRTLIRVIGGDVDCVSAERSCATYFPREFPVCVPLRVAISRSESARWQTDPDRKWRLAGSGMSRERPRLLGGCAATSLCPTPVVAGAGRSRRIQWQGQPQRRGPGVQREGSAECLRTSISAKSRHNETRKADQKATGTDQGYVTFPLRPGRCQFRLPDSPSTHLCIAPSYSRKWKRVTSRPLRCIRLHRKSNSLDKRVLTEYGTGELFSRAGDEPGKSVVSVDQNQQLRKILPK